MNKGSFMKTVNLCGSGQHGDFIARLTVRIHQWQAATGDGV